ncbi:MAG TPA: (2Fe-2S)-binding protein [Tepidisphaeraceae bacterium]|jgi:aerobic-type carbon monoxide dehydrogenase small subunit (CoxS/CutS family)
MAQEQLTRRGFLKGAGLAAAGAAIADSGIAAMAEEAAAAGPKTVGPGMVNVSLTINGQVKKISLEPRTTLAEALRYHVDMTGTKIVCDRGSCSACTVWIDGTPELACMTLALDAQGKQITTIEGLAHGDELHPVQEEFIEHDAMQCGFCTPGMIMSCAALLERNKNPSLAEVQTAVSGNLCRCGTYPKVFDATLAAAKKM